MNPRSKSTAVERLWPTLVCTTLLVTWGWAYTLSDGLTCPDRPEVINTTTTATAVDDPSSTPAATDANGNSDRILPIFHDSTVRFYLFGTRIGSEEIFAGSPLSVRKSNFSSAIQTKILIHGFRRNGFSDFPHFVKNAYLAYGYEVNIVCVDWKRLAGERLYINAAYNTRFVAERVGDLLIFLKDQKFIKDFRHVHIIGFSLGAQVGGYIGKYILSKRNLKIGRITGLDPAGPGFTGPDSSNRLDKDDADFVDVIHTSVKSGLHTAIGHADFFPNGGDYQPGCSFEYFVDPVLGGCSHQRSFELYIESIRGTKLYGCLCGNWTMYEGDECGCDSPSRLTLMGEHIDPTVRGSFYLRTGSAPPYLPPPKE